MDSNYMSFLKSKIVTAPVSGFKVKPADISPALKPHQRDAVGYLEAAEDEMYAPTLFDLLEGGA